MKTKLVLITGMLFCIACSEQKEESINPEPLSVSVSEVKIVTMPLTDGGAGWDTFSEADVYFTIQNNHAVLYKHIPVKENIKSNELPYRFAMNAYELPLINDHYTVKIYDHDSPDADDLIGEASFNPYQVRMDRQSKVILSGPRIKIELSLRWK